MIDRDTLPNDIEMERACVGSAMVDSDSIPLMIEAGLQRGHFFDDNLGNAWDAVLHLFERNDPVNQITVANVLAQKGLLDDFGGQTELGFVVRSLLTSEAAPWYAGRVVNYARRRVLVGAVTRCDRILYEGTDEDVQRIPELILRAASDIGTKGLVSYQDALREEVAPGLTLADIIMGEEPVGESIPTGFAGLDEQLGGGWMRQGMYTILAHTSAGKSWFCLSAVRHALSLERPCLYVNTEMGQSEVIKRMVFLEAGYDRVKYMRPAPEDIDSVIEAEKQAAVDMDLNIRFLTGKPTLEELATKVKLAVELYGCSFVVIDTLKSLSHRAQNSAQRMAELAEGIKGIALKYNVAILVAHHVSRTAKDFTGTRPLARLDVGSGIDSSAVEQQSDAVITLESVEQGSLQQPRDGFGLIDEQQVAWWQREMGYVPIQLYVHKQRSGPKWPLTLALNWDYGGRFMMLEDVVRLHAANKKE